MPRYREMVMDAPDAERMPFWSSDEDTGPEDLAAWLASIGNGAEAGAGAAAGAGGVGTLDEGFLGGGAEVS
jgi:hypothetical protein